MGWQVYVFGAVGCFVVFNLVSRVVAVKSEDPRAGAFVFNLWCAMLALGLFVVQFSGLNISITNIHAVVLLPIMISVLAYGLFERFQLVAKKGLEASISSILFRLAPVITFILSILFLREPINWEKMAGITLVIIANLILVGRVSEIKANKALLLCLLCTVFLGVAWTSDKVVTNLKFPAEIYSLIVWAMPLPIILIPGISLDNLKREVFLGGGKIPIMAITNVLGFYFQLKALALVDASKVIPITTGYFPIVVVLAIFLLNERKQMTKKIFAATVALAGILLLGRS